MPNRMSAADVTPKQIAYLREFVSNPRCMSYETIRSLEDALDALEAACTERDRLRAELDRLSARLEISDDHPFDGIECRNITIRGLEQDIASMREQLRVARLSAQGGEVPDLDNYETRPCEPRVANEDPEDWCAIAQWESERADAWRAFAQLQARPAPPHPDTVEVSREEWDAMCGVMTLARACAKEQSQCPRIHSHRDQLRSLDNARSHALRAQAQPATEREGA